MTPKILLPVLLAAAAAGGAWYFLEEEKTPPEIAWGSVDTRQVSLAFETSGRIARLAKEEGERVEPGEVLGELDVRLKKIERTRAQAESRALEAAWRLARDGNREEDVRAARALKESIEAELELARRTEKRQADLLRSKATSRQSYDDALWERKTLEKRLAATQSAFERTASGLRPDEVVQARAQFEASVAAVSELDYQIETASKIVSPASGVIRSRLAEPGDMASAAKTVYEISVTSPKWVRVFVSETQLAFVKEGAEALVTTDTTPPVKATVGFIASTAEFTPKTVQTQELRTVLVYEVRLNVDDPENQLRLGQPVTVDFAPGRPR